MMFDCVPVVSVISPITITRNGDQSISSRFKACQEFLRNGQDDGAHEGQDDQAQLEQQEATDSRGVFPDVFLVSPLSRRTSSSMRRDCSSSSQLLACGMLGQSASTDVLSDLPNRCHVENSSSASSKPNLQQHGSSTQLIWSRPSQPTAVSIPWDLPAPHCEQSIAGRVGHHHHLPEDHQEADQDHCEEVRQRDKLVTMMWLQI